MPFALAPAPIMLVRSWCLTPSFNLFALYLDRFHGLDDVLIACTTTEIAGDGTANIVIAGIGVIAQQLGGRHQHAGGAVAALKAIFGPERFLQGSELPIPRQPLYRGDGRTIGADGQDRARFHDLPGKHDSAGSAVAGEAANIGARQAQYVAYAVDEEHTRIDVDLVPRSVDGKLDRHCPGLLSGLRRNLACSDLCIHVDSLLPATCCCHSAPALPR